MPPEPPRPDFLLVGAPKCGTTALARYLGAHPDIFMPSVKELHYFGSDLDFPGGRIGEPEYRSHFQGAGAAEAAGEASVWYLYSATAAEEIRAYRPDARIIVMLREPGSMLHSLHGQFLYNGNEDIEDFAAALAAELDRRAGRRVPPTARHPQGLWYTAVVAYATQLRRFYRAFPAEQIHVILYEDLARDPDAVYQRTLAFLGLPPWPLPRYEQVNARKRNRSARLGRLLGHPPPAVRRAAHCLPDAWRRWLGRRLVALNTRQASGEAPDPEAVARIRRVVAPEIEQLEAMLGRDLSAWKPDQAK